MSVTTLAGPPKGMEPIPLSGSRWATIRPIESSDWRGLLDFYRSLSPEARYTRFLGVCPGIGADAARDFADAHLRGAAGFVAVLREAGPQDGRVIGHLCIEPVPDGPAEVAVAVADDVRRVGLGRRLMAAAMDASRRSGIGRLVASMFLNNEPMRRLFLSAGGRVTRQTCRAGVASIELATDD